MIPDNIRLDAYAGRYLQNQSLPRLTPAGEHDDSSGKGNWLSPDRVDIRGAGASDALKARFLKTAAAETRPHVESEGHKGRHFKSAIADDLAEALHISTEIGSALALPGPLALLNCAGQFASGIYFGVKGGKELGGKAPEGGSLVSDSPGTVKPKMDTMEKVTCTGHLALCGDAIASSIKIAGKAGMLGALGAALAGSAALTALAGAFGVVHGASDAIEGGKEVYDGIKSGNKKQIACGALDIGIGASAVALTVGGGIPAAVALGTIFLSKLLYTNSGAFNAAGKKLLSGVAHLFRHEEASPRDLPPTKQSS